MDRARKKQLVSELNARLGEVKSLYLTDFTGLDVASMTELRRKLTDARVEYVVVKNTLARRALDGSPYAELKVHLEGPNAFAMSTEDVVSAAKILSDFAAEHERPRIKAGAIEGRIVSMEEIRRLATLPPRDVLLAEVVGYARAPVAGLVQTLSGLLAKLVRTLDAVRAEREAAEPAPEAAAAEEAGEAKVEAGTPAEPAGEEAEPVVEEAEPVVEEAAPAEEVEAPKVEEETAPAEEAGESDEESNPEG